MVGKIGRLARCSGGDTWPASSWGWEVRSSSRCQGAAGAWAISIV
jgi:hypothetical protein